MGGALIYNSAMRELVCNGKLAIMETVLIELEKETCFNQHIIAQQKRITLIKFPWKVIYLQFQLNKHTVFKHQQKLSPLINLSHIQAIGRIIMYLPRD